MLTVARAVGALCALGLVFAVAAILLSAAGERPPRRDPPFEFRGKAKRLESMPALAMEFVENPVEVEDYLGPREGDGDSVMRRKLRGGLAADNVFIAFYWLLFAGLCLLLARRGWRFALWLAVLAAVCATGAAVTDTVENAHTATLLDAAAVTKPLVRNVAAASSEKWALSALATLALAPVFLWEGVGWARRFGVGLFVLYLLAGTLTLWGVFGERPLLVALAFRANFLGALVIAFVFTLRPGWAAGVSKGAAAETRRATR